MKFEKNDDKCEDRKDEKTKMMVDDSGGGCLKLELTKCLMYLPNKWNSNNSRIFLNYQGEVQLVVLNNISASFLLLYFC